MSDNSKTITSQPDGRQVRYGDVQEADIEALPNEATEETNPAWAKRKGRESRWTQTSKIDLRR